MRAVLQRAFSGNVVVDDQVIGEIGKGVVALVGFSSGDDEKAMDYMIDKITNLRIFEDDQDKMNLSVKDIEGQVLIVPNFTLYGDCRRGRRPSYSHGAPVKEAAILFEKFVERFKASFQAVQTGQFQADMKVTLLNDGPVTLLLDSDKEF